MMGPDTEDLQSLTEGLSEARRGAVRIRIHEAIETIEVARDIERQRPGVFHETRRPH